MDFGMVLVAYTKWAPLALPEKAFPEMTVPSESSMSTVVFTVWVTTLLLHIARNKRRAGGGGGQAPKERVGTRSIVVCVPVVSKGRQRQWYRILGVTANRDAA